MGSIIFVYITTESKTIKLDKWEQLTNKDP